MANEEKQIQINLDPVLYALSNVNMGFNEEVFDLVMISGNQARQFRVSPKHAKRIYLLLGKYLTESTKKWSVQSVVKIWVNLFGVMLLQSVGHVEIVI